jgi:hypothetical protein
MERCFKHSLADVLSDRQRSVFIITVDGKYSIGKHCGMYNMGVDGEMGYAL